MPIGGPWKQGMGKVGCQFLFLVHAPSGFPKDLKRNRWTEVIFEKPLVCGGVIEPQEGLVSLFEFHRRLGQGELIIV